MSGQRSSTRLLLCLAPIVVALLSRGRLPQVLQPLLVGSLIFFSPGAAWLTRRDGDACEVLFRVVTRSWAAVGLCWGAAALLPGPTNRTTFLVALLLVTALGWWRSGSVSQPKAGPRPLLLPLTLIAALFYAQSYIGAAHAIPILEDQDMEVQGTAYALIHDGTPAMVTNRGTSYFFAHPPFLHFLIGMSALITNELDGMRYYYESAAELRGQSEEAMEARFTIDYARFEREPRLLMTRTPNLFLGVFVLFPLAAIVWRLTGSRLAALGAAVVYATLPEIYVRSAYGGYAAITNFLSMSAMFFYLRSAGLTLGGVDDPSPESRGRGMVAGFLNAWGNQKSVMAYAAIGLHAAIRQTAVTMKPAPERAAGWRPFAAAVAIVAAFFAGWAAYAVYGYAIAPDEFIRDHFMTHFVDRLQFDTVHLLRVPEGASKYPSIAELWQQYFQHMGWLIALPCVLGVMWSATRMARGEGALLLWIAIGGLGFSVIDWRQTKHLSQLAPAFVALAAIFWASRRRSVRLALSIVAVAGVGWNLWRIGQLMADFSYLQPYRMW